MADIEKNEKVEKVDVNAMNIMVNKAVKITTATLKSRTLPKERIRKIAEDIAKRAMPSGVNLSHEAGDSFIEAVKSLHVKEAKTKAKARKATKKGK